MGDVFFTLIACCRLLKINPDACVDASRKKFIQRMKMAEEILKSRNIGTDSLSKEDVSALWCEVKQICKTRNKVN